jgi:hypothetical protein
VKFVETNFTDRISRIADPELLEEQQDFSREISASMKEKSMECLLSVINIGLHCTKASPNERMGMQEVAAKLHGIKEAYLKLNFGKIHSIPAKLLEASAPSMCFAVLQFTTVTFDFEVVCKI